MTTINEMGEFGVPSYDPESNRARAYAGCIASEARMSASPKRDTRERTHDPRERTCDVCGRKFIPGRGDPKRCSAECSKEMARRRARQRWRERKTK